ncbi:MAG: MMPL family transporter [Planctomycetota bacterium]
MSSRLWSYALVRPRLTLALLIGAVLAAAPGGLLLQIRTDGSALVPRTAPEVLVDAEIRALFDLEDPLAVTVETTHPDGIFNETTLALVVRLAADLAAEVARASETTGTTAHVVSIAPEKGGRVIPGTLNFRAFLDPLPTTPAELHRVREDLAKTQIYTGTLISVDGQGDRTWRPSATSILVGTPNGIDRFDFYQRIHDIAHTQTPDGHTIRVVGAPAAEVLLGRHLLADLGLLIPLAAIAMSFVFLFAFRSGAAALLGASEVVACLVFVFGVIGYCSVPIYLTIAVLPVILTVVGVADEIHLFHRFQSQLATDASGNRRDALLTVLPLIAPPIIRTSVTSALAFTSFCFSPLAAVQAFGAFAAVGIVFCMLWSLAAIPAALLLIPTRFLLPRRPVAAAARWQRIGSFVVAKRGLIVGVGVVLVAVAVLQLPRVRVQDSWVDGFAEDSRFARDTRQVNELFFGIHLLEICLDTRPGMVRGTLVNTPATDRALPLDFELQLPSGAKCPPPGRHVVVRATAPNVAQLPQSSPLPYTASPFTAEVLKPAHSDSDIVALRRTWDSQYALYKRQGPFEYEVVSARCLAPTVLAAFAKFETFLQSLVENPALEVGGVLGPEEQLRTVNFIAGGYRAERRTSGANARENEEIQEHYRNVRGSRRLHQLVDPANEQARLTLFLEDADFISTAHLLRLIADYAQEHLRPHGIALRLAGDVAVSQAMIDAVVATQLRSLALSLLGVLIIATILQRSVVLGVLATTPATLAVVVSGAMMAVFEIPLGVATSMFAGMTLGIGVDYAIHFIARWQQLHEAGDPEAVQHAIVAVGRPIWIDVIVIGGGFGLLAFSQVPANHRLGLLVLVSLVTCSVATLTLLPAALSFLGRRRNTTAVS